MVVYSRNDPLLCITFPSDLKGVASDWFSSLSPHSLYNFEEITKAFLTRYASHQEEKKNHYLLSVKMRQSESLKLYISFFQSQLAKVPNCGEDVFALAFISGLQISHPLYKHLLKHNVTWMTEVLFGAQPNILLVEAMKTSFNHITKHGDVIGKSKSPHEASANSQDRNWEKTAFKRQALPILSPYSR